MTSFAKAMLGTGAAAAVLASSVSPALARHDNDGISAGDIIAGAVVLGGIAAVAGAIGNDRRDGAYSRGGRIDGYGNGDFDRYGYDSRYYGYRSGNARRAVEHCVRAAERDASRFSYGRADVTDIRDIDRNSRGYTVRGRIAVNSHGRDWRRGDSDYGRGWNGDYRGWNDRLRGYDSGRFKCRVEYGRVVDLDFSGIRGL